MPEALVVGVTVPQVAPLQPAPDKAQLTPLLPESFATAAENVVEVPICTLAIVFESVTAIPGAAAVTVIVAAAVFVPSATDVAVSVTFAGLGTAAGAVYVMAVPEALFAADKVPHVAALQPAPESAQVTPLFALSFATVAVTV
jgi:hypothetical protein